MFSDNTVQWINTLKRQQQVYLYCWLVSFGMGIKKEWSEKQSDSYTNSARHVPVEDEFDGHAEEMNVLGKGRHMGKEVKDKLISDITSIYASGCKDPHDIYATLQVFGKLPNIDGVYITTRTVFRYVRRVRDSMGEKKNRLVHMEIDEAYRSGVTEIKDICAQLKRSYTTVYHALVKHGHIKPLRHKFKGRY